MDNASGRARDSVRPSIDAIDARSACGKEAITMTRWSIDGPSGPGIPSARLRQVLKEATFVGDGDWQVSGLSTDAKTIEPGQVYIALDGQGGDDESVGLAVKRGAAGLVVERSRPDAGRPQAVVPDAGAAHAKLCHALAGDPAERLDVVGIAGTREAGEIAARLRAIFALAGEKFGAIGSAGWSDGADELPVGPSPLDAQVLAGMLGAIASRDCVGALVEFSPESLRGPALEGPAFAAAIVTGVRDASEDDLDAREACRRTFARLVRRVRPGGFVVIDADDPDSEILGAVNLDAERVSIGVNRPADLRAEVMLVGPLGVRFRLVGMGLDATVTLRAGDFDTVRHSLAAAAAARQGGVDEATIVAGLESVDGRPGRPERVEEGQPFAVLVDGSRTPDELGWALEEARPARPGRVICVVGSEGHSDRVDRCRLAEAAEAGADVVIFTSDNPRGEDPARILDELLAGTRRPGRARAIADRREAIEAALALAAPGDAVVIAGKGSHSFQITAESVVPFDDRDVAARRLRASRPAARRTSA
jgi:UDP-N-acetylmuramoyl-L-alanyl-D-glutamate--2,6-diaminopimelate ligase